MSIRKILEQGAFAAVLVRHPRMAARCLRSKGVIRSYLSSAAESKLHLGAGPVLLDGWLNTDKYPASSRIAYVDTTKRFPFARDTFEYVFSEHMIEHMSWQAGARMLKECHRVLVPGGIARIATPDLGKIVGLYGHSGDPDSERYIALVTDTFLKGIGGYKASFVINNGFRNWGHQFLYDRDLLGLALRRAGFEEIRFFTMGESDEAALRRIESRLGENRRIDQPSRRSSRKARKRRLRRRNESHPLATRQEDVSGMVPAPERTC